MGGLTLAVAEHVQSSQTFVTHPARIITWHVIEDWQKANTAYAHLPGWPAMVAHHTSSLVTGPLCCATHCHSVGANKYSTAASRCHLALSTCQRSTDHHACPCYLADSAVLPALLLLLRLQPLLCQLHKLSFRCCCHFYIIPPACMDGSGCRTEGGLHRQPLLTPLVATRTTSQHLLLAGKDSCPSHRAT
jgi:hypothetical protein